MAIVWGAARGNFRLGIDLIDNGSTFTWIVYGQSIAYGHNWSYTLSFSGTWGSSSKTGHFTSGYGETKTVELHRTTGSRVTSSNTVTLNSVLVSGATVSRSITVTPKPAAPSNISVARNSDSSHTVSWTRNATATSVRLERRTNGGAWQHVSSVSSNAASITDTTTKAGNRYQYRVRVANAGGTSDWSNLSSVVYTTPPVPTGVTATRVGDNIRVNGSVHANASHVDIQDDGTTVVSALAKGSLPWTHSSPSQVVTHRYRMRARVASGAEGNATLYSAWSAYSATVQLTAPPSAPTGLNPNGLTVESGSQVSLSWSHAPVDSSEQTAYELRHRLDGGAWTTLSGTTASSRSLTVGAGVVEWQVRTKGTHPDWSPWSAVATVTVVDRPTVAILSPDEGQFFEAVLPVSWSFFQGQGRPQSAWRAQLLRDGQVLETKQGTGSASSTTFSTRLEDGYSYTVEVDAASGSIWSAVESVSVDASFILPAPAVLEGVWNDGTGAVDLQVSVLEQTPHADVVNLAPRIEGDGTWAEVRRNLVTNPNGLGGAGWSIRWQASSWDGSDMTEDGVPFRRYVRSGSAGTFLLRTTSYAPIEGETYRHSVDIRVFTVINHARMRFGGVNGSFETLPAGEWVRLELTAEAVSTSEVLVNIEFALPEGTMVDVRRSLLEVGATGGDFFDGDTPDFSVDPDMRQRWLGEENASESVMEIEQAAGISSFACVVGVSSWEGKPALRQIPTLDGGVGIARISIPAGLRDSGTLLATTHLRSPLSGSLNSLRLNARVTSPSQYGSSVPDNSAGSFPQRVHYSSLSSLYRAELIHGGLSTASGDVWWTDIGLYAGVYQGGYFDGDTGWVQIDGVWMHTRWNSDGTSTASMPDDAVSMTVERSVDGGTTWSPVLTDETGVVQVADHEALSNGVTIYRVTTYAATGAATVREYSVGAYSEAGWLGVGVAHGHTVRLPYSPQISVTAGRERALKRYSGRAKPVVYAGEHVSRTVDTGGMILVNDPDNATFQQMLEAAQDPEPTALWRDPTGAHVVGMLSDIQVTRQSHAHWAYGFQLEESED